MEKRLFFCSPLLFCYWLRFHPSLFSMINDWSSSLLTVSWKKKVISFDKLQRYTEDQRNPTKLEISRIRPCFNQYLIPYVLALVAHWFGHVKFWIFVGFFFFRQAHFEKSEQIFDILISKIYTFSFLLLKKKVEHRLIPK